LATDLATGQPLEHGLRRTLLAVGLGLECVFDDDQLRDTFYVALLGSVGCVLDTAALARFLNDDIAARAGMFALDMDNPLVALPYLSRSVARGLPFRRITNLVGLATQLMAICRDVALGVGRILDLGDEIAQALGQCDEHWNGKSGVLGLRGEQISIHARIFRLAQDIDVFYRLGGLQTAVAVVQQRSGTYYDPRLVAVFSAHAAELLGQLEQPSTWEATLAAEPDPVRTLDADAFDTVTHQVANFIDMRSAYTVGHSPAVATLAEAAGHRLGLGADDALTLRNAGLLHDLGRAGVPVAVWNKSDPLTPRERGQVEGHPRLTELVLARSTTLSQLGTLAGLHHERLDGSGYRGVSATSLPLTSRVLAVADAYQSRLEPRPYRPLRSAADAAADVRAMVRAGKLDGEVAEAVLEVAGHTVPVKSMSVPAGLTRREVEVLGLLVRGMSNREIAESLVLTPKTVGHHIESIYSKIGVSSRVGATLFAIEHGLVAPIAQPIRP
jgi:HD-GYP domain-containing protein (c-di-GMP phosphodiesterase class II)/DNA-binding CsgD family transcriptional regulator